MGFVYVQGQHGHDVIVRMQDTLCRCLKKLLTEINLVYTLLCRLPILHSSQLTIYNAFLYMAIQYYCRTIRV